MAEESLLRFKKSHYDSDSQKITSSDTSLKTISFSSSIDANGSTMDIKRKVRYYFKKKAKIFFKKNLFLKI